MTTPPVDDQEMSIWDHISELRKRIIIGLAAVVVTTLASVFMLATPLIEFLARPAGGLSHFIVIEVTESVGVYMRVALLAGFILSLPIIVSQIIAFILPGLYPNEKRWLYWSIPLASLFFLGGVAFSYYVMLPTAIPFLQGFLAVTPAWRLANYIGFVTNLMFWIGLAFESPLVVFLLAKFHVVSAGMLARQWRYAIVIIAIIAAVVTPTVDPVNMSLLMAPLFALYLLSILFAYIGWRE